MKYICQILITNENIKKYTVNFSLNKLKYYGMQNYRVILHMVLYYI